MGGGRGRGRGRGSWCPATSCSTSTTADDGPAHVFPQIPASGAQFPWRRMGLTAQNDYSLSKDCQLVRNNSRPEYFPCPIRPRRIPPCLLAKLDSLITTGPLLFTKENKKKRQRLSPSTPPPTSPAYPPATMSPPADGKLGKGESGTARILGSGASGQSHRISMNPDSIDAYSPTGVAELMVFHPVVRISNPHV